MITHASVFKDIARCLPPHFRIQVDPAAREHLLWSQPKQTGDMINDAMHELLIYRPKAGHTAQEGFAQHDFQLGLPETCFSDGLEVSHEQHLTDSAHLELDLFGICVVVLHVLYLVRLASYAQASSL